MQFSIGGEDYSIDLTEQNEAKFRDLLAPYIEKAERVGRQRGRSTSSTPRRSGGSNATMREWARANGYKVSDRGRIPADVVAAFEAAN